MKYLVIGHKFGLLGRGGYHISKRFCDEHIEYCEFKEDRKARNLEKLNRQYRRIIFRTQVPRCYSIPANFVRLRKINHIFYLRSEHLSPLYNNCTNGFYYYHRDDRFNNYIPMITDFPVQEIIQPQEICLGFYCRKWLTPDSYDCFIDLLDSLKTKVNVALLGDDDEKIKNHNMVLHYNHTNVNVQFWSYVTHYVYPTSKYFIDPFPHSVVEAVQCGKTIIFPTIERDFKDGIDDIKDVIRWETSFKHQTNINKHHPFKAKLWHGFYKDVFDSNWEFKFDRNSIKTFDKFVEYLL